MQDARRATAPAPAAKDGLGYEPLGFGDLAAGAGGSGDFGFLFGGGSDDGTGFGAGVVRKERGEWGRGPAARSAAPRPPCRPLPTSRSLALQDMAAQLAIPSRLRVKLPPSRLGGVSAVVGDALDGWRGGGGSPGRPEPANEAA